MNGLGYYLTEAVHILPLIILFQFLVTYLLNPLLLVPTQPLPNRAVHLNDTQRFRMAHHVHILEAFEGIGEDVPLGLLVGIAALGKDAVGFLHLQTGSTAGFVEAAEIGDNIGCCIISSFVSI